MNIAAQIHTVPFQYLSLCVVTHPNHSDPDDPARLAKPPHPHVHPCSHSSNSILLRSSHIIFHGTFPHERRRHDRVSPPTFVFPVLESRRIFPGFDRILKLVVGTIVANHFAVMIERAPSRICEQLR